MGIRNDECLFKTTKYSDQFIYLCVSRELCKLDEECKQLDEVFGFWQFGGTAKLWIN